MQVKGKVWSKALGQQRRHRVEGWHQGGKSQEWENWAQPGHSASLAWLRSCSPSRPWVQVPAPLEWVSWEDGFAAPWENCPHVLVRSRFFLGESGHRTCEVQMHCDRGLAVWATSEVIGRVSPAWWGRAGSHGGREVGAGPECMAGHHLAPMEWHSRHSQWLLGSMLWRALGKAWRYTSGFVPTGLRSSSLTALCSAQGCTSVTQHLGGG